MALRATTTPEPQRPAGAGDVLVFMVGGSRCAVPLAHVHEVARAVAITPLPTAPPIVEGVINVRGTVVPVVDLRSRLDLPPEPLRPEQRLIVVQAGARTVALRVDDVDWVSRVRTSSVAEPERIARGIGWLAGVARLRDGLVLLHDLDSFFRQGEAEALDAALAARSRGTA
jgi:purine-binding chemotaxis protein CheW